MGGPNSQRHMTSFRRHVPNRFLINQCQIITFLILKYDIIENSRIELRGIVLPVQVGGLLGGPKGMLAPPLKLLGGGAGPPSSYAYVTYDWGLVKVSSDSVGTLLNYRKAHINHVLWKMIFECIIQES